MSLLIAFAVLAAVWFASRFTHVSDAEVSEIRLGQLIAEANRAEEARRIEDELARAHPDRYPHRFAAGDDVWVRAMSHAEIERREQEKRALQFLRGGRS